MIDLSSYLVLGLDPGIASCGFALLDMNNHVILEMGSHLFAAPQESKNKVSLAVGRRNARGARRNNMRTKSRMSHCLELLIKEGLVPENSGKTWFQSRKGDKPILKLRARGLDMLLSDREFAQVLYSLCGRRGYIPHGEGRLGETDDVEGKKVLTAIKENAALMASKKFRTVGEMLNSLGSSRNKGGQYTNCVYNSQVQDEVRMLFATQRNLGNTKAEEKLEEEYLACLTWEKSSCDYDARIYDLVGLCSYFSDENQKRAAKADISSELCRAYEKLGHLTIVRSDGSGQVLTKSEINRYISILFSTTSLPNNKNCKVRYTDIRRDLDLSARDCFKGIDTDQEKKSEIFAPKSWRCLRDLGLPNNLLQRMFDDRPLGDAIGEALTFASSEASLQSQLEELDLTGNDIQALLGVPFTGKLFKGYGSRSLKALSLLLDAFEDPAVHTLTDAEEASGLLGRRLADHGVKSTLLPPYSSYDPTCHNPVVLRAMGRMRHIVNSIIKIYGVPDEIHIELGRELKQSAHEKKLIHQRQLKNEASNKKWAEDAAVILGIEPDAVRPSIIRKLALREEQGEKDIYSGDSIDLERLVKDNHYCEIDHVLPYSRTCDDSRANKVLVLSESNQDKRERTPYEWMTSEEKGAPNWEIFRTTVLTEVKDSRKRSRLLNTNLDSKAQGEFISRNLNDDRYMSVAVKNYLEDCLLFPEGERKKHVSAVSGGATGNLRWVWGLNFGANNSKDRNDDRHHAVDAAVIASCTEKTVKEVAQASSKGRKTFKQLRESRLANTQPWPAFAEDIIARRELIIPTRAANHGVTGNVFQDYSYRLEERRAKGYVKISRKDGGSSRREDISGNYRIKEGSVRLLGGMAFVRLWLDDSSGKNGKWYVEPVYYAELPSIRDKSYVPRYAKQKVARSEWPIVPLSALQNSPVYLFSGDVLEVDGHLARYRNFDIGGCSLVLNSLLDKNAKAAGFPSISKWQKNSTVRTFQEDCLGHCYKGVVVDSNDSSFARSAQQ